SARRGYQAEYERAQATKAQSHVTSKVQRRTLEVAHRPPFALPSLQSCQAFSCARIRRVYLLKATPSALRDDLATGRVSCSSVIATETQRRLKVPGSDACVSRALCGRGGCFDAAGIFRVRFTARIDL